MKIYNFIPAEKKTEVASRLLLLKEGKLLPPYELELDYGDDKRLPVEINSKVIYYEGERAILTLIRDLTERKNIQQKIMQTIMQTEENERSRFAKDLHDGLGPLLSAMGIYLNAFSVELSDERKKFALESMERTIDEAILSIKEISNNISPHILQNFGLHEAIRSFLDRFMHINEVRFIYENSITERFSPMLEISIYRIIAEFITNSIKHAKANNITIKIYSHQETIIILYKDDGVGFNIKDVEKKSRGMGLFSIKNRIATLNGKISIYSKINKGVKIDVELNRKINKHIGMTN